MVIDDVITLRSLHEQIVDFVPSKRGVGLEMGERNHEKKGRGKEREK